MADQISNKYQCIFVHIPKAGGTSIENTVIFDDQREETGETVGGHLTASDFRLKYRNDFPAYFKLAIVRNPYDRLVSAFSYLAQYRGSDSNNLAIKNLISEKYNRSFQSFCEGFLSSDNIRQVVHLRPQVDFLLDEHGKIIVDFVGKLERMQDDFNIVCSRLGINILLPHRNLSVRRDYSGYYTSSLKKIVEQIYEQDLILFKYEFEYDRLRAIRQDIKACYACARKFGGKVLLRKR